MLTLMTRPHQKLTMEGCQDNRSISNNRQEIIQQ
jgi:hypothetical protein